MAGTFSVGHLCGWCSSYTSAGSQRNSTGEPLVRYRNVLSSDACKKDAQIPWSLQPGARCSDFATGCLECLVWHILGPKIFTINSSSWHGIRLSTRTWWMLSSIWCFFRIKNSAEVLERNPTCQTCGPNFGTFTGFPLPSKVQNYVGSSPAAAWGHMCNSRFLSQRQRTELLAKFSNAVHGTEIVGVPSSQLKQALVLGHCSDLLFYMTQKLVTALHGWKTCHALQLFGRSPVLGAVWRALMTLQCEDIRPGVFSFSHGVWNCPCPLGFLPKLQHNFSSTLARYAFQSPFLPLLILDLRLTCLRFA